MRPVRLWPPFLRGGAAALVDWGLVGALAGGAAALALRLVADALARVVVFAPLCRLLRLDKYLYLESVLRRAFLRGVGRIRARAL